MNNSTAVARKNERTIKMTVCNNSHKIRRPNWRHIGWAVSWGLFYLFVAPVTLYSFVTWITNGTSFFQEHPGIQIAAIIIAAWTMIRNKIAPTEYLRLYKKGLR